MLHNRVQKDCAFNGSAHFRSHFTFDLTSNKSQYRITIEDSKGAILKDFPPSSTASTALCLAHRAMSSRATKHSGPAPAVGVVEQSIVSFQYTMTQCKCNSFENCYRGKQITRGFLLHQSNRRYLPSSSGARVRKQMLHY